LGLLLTQDSAYHEASGTVLAIHPIRGSVEARSLYWDGPDCTGTVYIEAFFARQAIAAFDPATQGPVNPLRLFSSTAGMLSQPLVVSAGWPSPGSCVNYSPGLTGVDAVPAQEVTELIPVIFPVALPLRIVAP
jgi:hypothetical protein